jgi:hypothetical protein
VDYAAEENEALESIECVVCHQPFMRKKYANRRDATPMHAMCRPTYLQQCRRANRVMRKNLAIQAGVSLVSAHALLYIEEPTQNIAPVAGESEETFNTRWKQWKKDEIAAQNRPPKTIYAYRQFKLDPNQSDKKIISKARSLVNCPETDALINGNRKTHLRLPNIHFTDTEITDNMILCTGGARGLALRIWWHY